MAKSRKHRNSVKHWNPPITGKDRRSMYKKCGSKCFLLPNRKSPGKSKFPICPKKSCKKSCKGILAARGRAQQWRKKHPSYNKVVSKANRLYSRQKCKKSRTKLHKSRRHKSRRHKSRKHRRYHANSIADDVDKALAQQSSRKTNHALLSRGRAKAQKIIDSYRKKSHKRSKSRRRSKSRKGRKPACSKKRKSRCMRSKGCRWNRRKSRCRKSRKYHSISSNLNSASKVASMINNAESSAANLRNKALELKEKGKAQAADLKEKAKAQAADLKEKAKAQAADLKEKGKAAKSDAKGLAKGLAKMI